MPSRNVSGAMIEPAVLIEALLPENRSSILISPCDFTFIVPLMLNVAAPVSRSYDVSVLRMDA